MTLKREPLAPNTGAYDAMIQAAVIALVFAAVTFNAGLALLNGHGLAMTNAIVTAAQGAIVAGALGVAALVRPRGVIRWMAVLWVMVLLFALLSLLRDRIELKYLGDVALIFAFVMLGMCAGGRSLARLLLGLQALICLIALWELISPGTFGEVFRVLSYYVATRGFQEDAFWSGNSELFVSSARPGGRLLLPQMAWHRASSLFLEPVSLGNWTVVVVLATAGLWRWLSRAAIAALIAGNVILLIACDGRLALLLNILLVPVLIVAPRLPRWVAPLTLPVTFIGVAAAGALGLMGVDGDTFSGRLQYGASYLENLNVASLMGISSATGIVAADSGWAYLMISQSLPGMILLWLALTLPIAVDTPERRRFVLGMAVFLSLALPVSYSVFSIKTAALLWAVYGFLSVAGRVSAASRKMDQGFAVTGRAVPALAG